jgi:hypothetical protein
MRWQLHFPSAGFRFSMISFRLVKVSMCTMYIPLKIIFSITFEGESQRTVHLAVPIGIVT